MHALRLACPQERGRRLGCGERAAACRPGLGVGLHKSPRHSMPQPTWWVQPLCRASFTGAVKVAASESSEGCAGGQGELAEQPKGGHQQLGFFVSLHSQQRKARHRKRTGIHGIAASQRSGASSMQGGGWCAPPMVAALSAAPYSFTRYSSRCCTHEERKLVGLSIAAMDGRSCVAKAAALGLPCNINTAHGTALTTSFFIYYTACLAFHPTPCAPKAARLASPLPSAWQKMAYSRGASFAGTAMAAGCVILQAGWARG